MAEWKKVVVSGSGADLTNISASGHIRPKSDDAVDLGSSAYEFRNLYLDGTAEIDALIADTADINAGTIDGVTIATSDITVGTGKALDVSGGTLTLAADQISGNAINGGTIGSITISQLAGALDANSQAITNVDINSGAIDGAAIGAASPDTGAFTSLSATLNTSLGGDVALGNALADDINVAGHITGSAGANVSMSLASTGSFGQVHATKLFGDGANITGIAFQIDGLANDLTSLDTGDLLVAADVSDGDEEKKITFGNLKAGIVDSINGQVNVDASAASTLAVSAITEQTNMTGDVADADELLINDNGALKRIDFSVLRDAVFNDVSGDIGIAAGGSVTIQANSVALGSDTTGNYVQSLANATNGGLTIANGSAEGGDATVALNINDLSAASVNVANDSIAILDADDNSSKKESIADVMTAVAGTGISAASGQLNVDGVLEDLNTLGAPGSDGQFIVATGTGAFQYETANTARTSLGLGTGNDVEFNDLVLAGDLTVNGSTVSVATTNLEVADAFILLASGSSGTADSGIIFQDGATGDQGVAFGFEQGEHRFVMKTSANLSTGDTTFGTPEAFVSAVVKDDSNSEYRKSGNIRVDESADEIYIYVE
jgi:hypothetical protein